MHAEGHGVAASVQEDTGSTSFSLPCDSSIRGSPLNSLHHPIHACAHSRLDSFGVGSGVGVGVGVCAGVSCVVPSGAVDDVDDACMDGSVTDVIHTVSNSVIQGFSEYHDGSCACLNALPNSRVERGHHVRGETKRSSGCLLEKRAFSQQQSVNVHDETWAGGQEILRLSISQAKEIQPRCAVSVFPLRISFLNPELPGRGEERVVPHSMVGPVHFLVFVFIRVWMRHSYRATYWCAVLATAHQVVEGYRSPDEAMVC